MKFAVLIAAAITIATPAMAQPTTWTTNQMGGQLNHTGYDQQGNIWTGTTTQMGGQTNSTYYSPSGQITTCSSYAMGGQVTTTCQ